MRRDQGSNVHLYVGGSGQIHNAARRLASVEFGEGRRADLVRSEHRLDEILEPALAVDPIPGLGPDAEFLDVIEVHRRCVPLIGQRFQIVNRVRCRGKRESVT